MLKPDPDSNASGDEAWFGVLTWVQPKDEVKKGRDRLVRATLRYSSLTASFIFVQCEIWWVYTRKHLIDFIKAGDAPNKKE